MREENRVATKAFLAKELKKPIGIPYTTAVVCVDVVLESIVSCLMRGETIELRGFGSFSVKTSSARKTGINGQMAVPRHGRVVFKPGEKLRRAVWNRGGET
jgi:integration host factor subunit beta